MATTTIYNELIAVNAVSGTAIADNAVTSVHIAQNNIGTVQLALNSVTSVSIALNQVTGTQIANNAITSTQLADNAVTATKIPDGTQLTLGATTITGDLTVDTNTLFVDVSANKVGVGTTSPASPLHIKTSTNHNLEFEEASGDLRISALNDARDTNEVLQFAASEFNFLTGNVGIGTTSPSAPLHVVGNSYVQSGTLYTDAITAYAGSSISINAGSSHLAMTVNSAERMRIASDGKVGIGTASPNRTLTVYGSSNGEMNLKNSSADFLIQQAGHNTSIGNSSSSGYINFFTNNGNANVRMLADGNVGIGYTSPEAPLHVQESYSTAYDGSAALNETLIASNSHGSDGSGVNNYSNLSFRVASGATSYGSINYIRTADNQGRFAFSQRQASSTYAEAMTILNDGKVGIGTTAPDDYNSYGDNLVVVDSAHSGISIVAGTTSQSTLMFADGTGGTAGYRGRVGYDHNADTMVLHTAAAERMRIDGSGRVGINNTLSDADLAYVIPSNTLVHKREGWHGGHRTHYGRTLKYSEGSSWASAIRIEWDNASWGGVNMRIKGQGYYNASDAFDVVIGFAGHAASASISYDATSNGAGTWSNFINLSQNATGETTIQQRSSNNTSDVEDIVFYYEWVTNNRSDQVIQVLDL